MDTEGKTGVFHRAGDCNCATRDRICMSADKNYSAKLSVIYSLQSCKIAPVEAKSDNVEESTPQVEYSFPKIKLFYLHQVEKQREL